VGYKLAELRREYNLTPEQQARDLELSLDRRVRLSDKRLASPTVGGAGRLRFCRSLGESDAEEVTAA
jgi:hypothetical protein